MNETKMGLFQRFFYSITSFDKYRTFLRLNTSKAVVYLLLLSLVVSLATFIPAQIEYNRIIDSMVANLDTTIPDFTLSNGKLEVQGKMPIILDDGTYPIIIDTTPGAEDVLEEYDIAMLVTSDKIIQKNYVDKTVTDLSAFQGMAVTRDSIVKTLPILKPLGIFIFIFMGIFFIAGKFITALIASLLGLIVNSIRGTNLTYRSIFKISVYAMTLPMIVCTVLDLIPFHIPLVWVLFYILTFVYIFGAITSIRKEIDNMSNLENTDDPDRM